LLSCNNLKGPQWDRSWNVFIRWYLSKHILFCRDA